MTSSFLFPTHTIICKVPQLSSEFQTQIQPQTPRRFPNASQRRAPIDRWVQNNDKYPFEHGEVVNYTLYGVEIHPVTVAVIG